MDNFDALKEAITEELFTKEPLALAIILYLQQENKLAYSQIVKKFDEVVSVNLDKLIKKHFSDDELE